jgi:hypothetical protein
MGTGPRAPITSIGGPCGRDIRNHPEKTLNAPLSGGFRQRRIGLGQGGLCVVCVRGQRRRHERRVRDIAGVPKGAMGALRGCREIVGW